MSIVQEATDETAATLTFEDALHRLEEIVGSMEEGDIALADLLSKYEEGNRLLKVCGKRLQDAELKIELLKKSAAGESLELFNDERS